MRTKFVEKLKTLGACREAVEWVGRRSASRAWRECRRGNWMVWYIGRVAAGEPGSPERVRLCACLEEIAAAYAADAAYAVSSPISAHYVAVSAADAAAAAYAVSIAISASSAISAHYVAVSAAVGWGDTTFSEAKLDALARYADIVRKHYPTCPEVPDVR